MIQGPLSGKVEEEAASAADVTALTDVVSGHTTDIAAKASVSTVDALTTTVATNTGGVSSLLDSMNNLGTSFYTRALTDGLLSGKENSIGDGGLTVARTSGLQAALDAKAVATNVYTKAASDALVDAVPVSMLSNYATMIHPSVFGASSTKYAVKHDSAGRTFLNGSDAVRIRVGNVSFLMCASNNVYHYKPIVSGSDARLKFNQRPIENGLATLMELTPKLYEKVFSVGDPLDQSAPTEAGFIAQEVDLIPSLRACVSRPNDVIDTFGLDYRQLGSPYQVAAIQELSHLVTALTARVAALE